MAIKALSVQDTVEYVSEADSGKGTPDETVWLLGLIPTKDLAFLRDSGTKFRGNPSAIEDVQIEIHSNTVAIDYLKLGLRGWRNFQDPATGGEVKYETNQYNLSGLGSRKGVTDKIVNVIPHNILMELANKIAEINTPGDDEVKNSEESA